MKVEVSCPNAACGKKYGIDESKLGVKATCKRCGTTFTLVRSHRDAASDAGASSMLLDSSGTLGSDMSSLEGSVAPTKLGRFEIRVRLGSGGFATVYRAYDPVLERDVALKVPRTDVLKGEETRIRFLREAKAAAQLQHPNIVPIFDSGKDGELYFIVSAFIEGRTLADLIAEQPPDCGRAAEIVQDLAKALHYAHEKGVVHRDVKPSNVMITEDGSPMLTDFGLARLARAREQLTRTGAVVGTPAYLAPEQADSSFGKVGPHSDQYGLGVVLYELLCKQPPFSGPPSVVIYNVLHQQPTPPRQLDPTIPQDLETICLRAIAKQPSQRYVSCAALRRAIDGRHTGKPSQSGAWSAARAVIDRCRGRRAVLAAGAVLLALVAAATYIQFGRRLAAPGARDEIARSQPLAPSPQPTPAVSPSVPASSDPSPSPVEAPSEETERPARPSPNAAPAKSLAERDAEAREEWARVWKLHRMSAQQPHTGELAPLELAPEPISTPQGARITKHALVTQPAALPGVLSWTLETIGHRGQVRAVSFSVDGRYLATAGDDGVVRIWDPASFTLLRMLVGHNDRVHDVQFCPRGPIAASCGADQTVRLWDAESGQLLRTYVGHRGQVNALAWSPDQHQLAAADSAGDVHIWDVRQGRIAQSLRRCSQRVLAAVWSPDGLRLATGGNDGTATLWDPANGEAIGALHDQETQHSGAEVRRLAWSADGQYLAALLNVSPSPRIWEMRTGRLVNMPEVNEDLANLVWASQHQILAAPSRGIWSPLPIARFFAVSSDGMARQIWTIDATRQVSVARDAAVWDEHANRLVFGGEDGALESYDLATSKLQRRQRGFQPTLAVTWSNSGNQLAASTNFQPLHIYSGSDGRLLATKDINCGSFLEWSLDDRKIACGGAGNSYAMIVENDSDRQIQLKCPSSGSGPIRCTWRPDGSGLVFGTQHYIAFFDNLAAASPLDNCADFGDYRGYVFCLSLSPSGSVLASSDGRNIHCWDARTAELLRTIDSLQAEPGAAARVRQLVWSPHAKLLAARRCVMSGWDIVQDAATQVWDPNTGELVSQLAATDAQYPPETYEEGADAIWLPDGETLCLSRRDAVLRRWNVNTGAVQEVPGVPAGRLSALGDQVAERYLDRVLIWDAATASLRFTIVPLGEEMTMVISPDGHYRAQEKVDEELAYVVHGEGGQETLTPAEFTARFGWTNDPDILRTNKEPRSAGDGMQLARPPGSAGPAEAAAATPPCAVAPFDASEAKRLQQAWADYFGAPTEITNSVGMKLVLIPPGEFDMGVSQEEISQLLEGVNSKSTAAQIQQEAPRHRVKITKPFYLSKYEVTVGQFSEFVEATGYQTEAERNNLGGKVRLTPVDFEQKLEYIWRNPEFAPEADYPVCQVSWNDATAFCGWLSTQEGAAYELPTEAIWEYACRAGTTTQFSSGDDEESLQGAANLCDLSRTRQFPQSRIAGVSWDDGYPAAAPVGRFAPNGFGLHDMHGNLREWCTDWFAADYYSQSPLSDPTGPPTGTRRVLRGGEFHYPPLYLRSAKRSSVTPDLCSDTYGIRPVRICP